MAEFGLLSVFLKKKHFPRNSKWPQNSIWKFFAKKIRDFVVLQPLYEMT
jgi:hypothetical protein